MKAGITYPSLSFHSDFQYHMFQISVPSYSSLPIYLYIWVRWHNRILPIQASHVVSARDKLLKFGGLITATQSLLSGTLSPIYHILKAHGCLDLLLDVCYFLLFCEQRHSKIDLEMPLLPLLNGLTENLGVG